MNFKIVIISLVAILCCFSSITAQDSETTESPQTQPAKKYSISQKFAVGMTFEKHLKHSITINLGFGGADNTVEMICNTEITIVKSENGVPKYVKVSYLKTSVTTSNSRIADKLSIDLKGHWFEGSVNEDFIVKVEKKSPDFPDLGQAFMKDFKIVEFAYPKENVDVNDTWEGAQNLSGILVKQVPGDYKTKFKLEKVTADDAGNDTSAQIKLTVDFTSDKEGDVRKIVSDGDHAYDLVNKRLDSSTVSSSVTAKITVEGQEYEMKWSLKTTIDYKYKSELKKVEEEPNTPKPVESE